MERTRRLQASRVHCPCMECQGRRKLLLTNVRKHLMKNGRHPHCRVWKGPGNRDSSDEEWEEEFWSANASSTVPLDAQVDTRGMLENAFAVDDPVNDIEDRVHQEVADAFMTVDAMLDECSIRSIPSEAENFDVVDDMATASESVELAWEDPQFDPHNLHEAIEELYVGARCTKLAATILLMNLCMVHGVSNTFADEMFAILHGHILPEVNCLPKNYHAAQSLTRTLGLAYTTIHACAEGCVLFRCEHVEATHCPKCNRPQYRDQERKKFPVKVLRHFPIISRLQ